jgi:hypothetical protein
MKAREYLVSKGLAKDGRGKVSNDAKAALTSALASGTVFEDYPKDATGPVAPKVDRPHKVKPRREAVDSGVVASIAYRFPEGEYVARETVSGKVRSMREACHTCRVSLVGHGCASPTIVSTDGTTSVAVTIVPA